MTTNQYLVTITNSGDEEAFSANDVRLAITNEAAATLHDDIEMYVTVVDGLPYVTVADRLSH